MGRGPKWGRETNWLGKSDITIFVKFARKLKVGLQSIYFYCIFNFRGNVVLYAQLSVVYYGACMSYQMIQTRYKSCVVAP